VTGGPTPVTDSLGTYSLRKFKDLGLRHYFRGKGKAVQAPVLYHSGVTLNGTVAGKKEKVMAQPDRMGSKPHALTSGSVLMRVILCYP